jgi:hypothetical protein
MKQLETKHGSLADGGVDFLKRKAEVVKRV